MTKAQILEEIQRTAKANGGVPLGVARFYSETGIKESDWHGKFWARWGDAVREAGFAPNQFNASYDKSVILDMYARLIQELGRLPTKGELKLKARDNAEFPSHNVFYRIGTKPQLVRMVLEFCRGRSGYEDVVQLCEQHTPREADLSDDAEPGEEEFGFVYLVKSGRFYKIGKSNSVGRREYELQIQLPEKASLVHEIRTDDPYGIEAYWHKRFEAKRRNGEWFELDPVDIKAFRRRKFM